MSQSISVISGALAAIAYAAAITGTGAALLWLGFRQRLADRPLVLGLLSLILGQGVVAVVWLAMALAGALRPAAVGLFTILGCLVLAVICRGQIRLAARPTSQPLPTFEAWIGRLVVVVLALRAIATMAPTRNDDALLMYLFTPRTIALEQGLSFQPFVMRHGLMPLQVEMHSAALFSLSNLTAVTVWDYLCSLSVLAAVWLIAVELASDEGIALIAVLIVVTTPAFALMMGAGKVDNAATQYGLAAVLWLLIGGRAGLVNGGLCVGWSIAARYTGVLMVPACAYLIGFSRGARERVKPAMAIAAVAAVAAAAPMAIKNLLLVGHPLAPMLGPADAFWVWRDYQGATRNLTWADVPLFPFIWTFGERSAMLGNISPLLLGLLPFSLLYRSAPEARRTRPALVTGSLIVLTWLLLQPRTMMTRYVLAGICLIAIGVAPALRLAYNEMGVSGRRITVTALLLLLGFWLVASGWTAGVGIRYAAGWMTLEQRYASKSGWDTAQWLNTHADQSDRVAVERFTFYPWFLRPEILRSSESREERSQLHAARGRNGAGPVSSAEWLLLQRWGYRYVIVPPNHLESSVREFPGDRPPALAFAGNGAVVLRLSSAAPRGEP